MFVGVIKTKDVVLNPRLIISLCGVTGYLKLLCGAMSFRRYSFLDFFLLRLSSCESVAPFSQKM